VASPERIKNISALGEIAERVGALPTINTITQAKISTTTVRSAVATSESVFRIPHLARIEVSPAKNAEAIAAGIQNITISSFCWLYLIHRQR